jgi:hypothetical protein
MSLVAAVLSSQKPDSQFFKVREAVGKHGIRSGYGNRSITGRTQRNLNRREAQARKRKEAEKTTEESY